jgi:hypothetical protein
MYVCMYVCMYVAIVCIEMRMPLTAVKKCVCKYNRASMVDIVVEFSADGAVDASRCVSTDLRQGVASVASSAC